METKKWWAIIGIFATVLGLAILTSFLCLKHFSQSRMSSGTVAAQTWAKKVNLSTEQKKKLEPLEASLNRDVAALQVRLASERMALCSLMRQEPADKSELDKYINSVSALEAEQQRRVVQHLLAVRDILTPQQKDQFFTAIMQDICQGCRAMTGSQIDMCAQCPIGNKK